MSNSPKLTSWCALVAVLAVVVIGRPCIADDATAKEVVHEAAQKAEAAESGGPNPLAFKTDLAVWTLVVFLALFFILKKFAWPQISAALDERERNIQANIDAALAQNNEAKRLLGEHEAKLAAAAGEVRALLDEARRDAETMRKRIEAEGQQAAKAELDRAVREIGRARDAALQDLAVSSANVAVDLARNIVKQDISPDRQKQLVHDALGKLAAASPSSN
jgi:F-type H+-transporting ATPase subunit b